LGPLAKRGPKKVTFRGKTSKTPILGGSKKGSKRVILGVLGQKGCALYVDTLLLLMGGQALLRYMGACGGT
jgi:hypothetical protein